MNQVSTSKVRKASSLPGKEDETVSLSLSSFPPSLPPSPWKLNNKNVPDFSFSISCRDESYRSKGEKWYMKSVFSFLLLFFETKKKISYKH